MSDFHALAVSSAGVVGYDGTGLHTTPDETSWRELEVPAEPHSLAASADGQVLLATTEAGLLRSADAGASWMAVDGAPLLQVVDWADGSSAVGVAPDGTVAVTEDAGVTWDERGAVAGPPQAVGASATGGDLRLLVVTPDAVLDSAAGGESFAPLTAP